MLNSYQTLIKNEAYQKYILYSLHLRNIMELFEEARVILVVQVHVYCLVMTLHHTEAVKRDLQNALLYNVFLDRNFLLLLDIDLKKMILQGKQVP